MTAGQIGAVQPIDVGLGKIDPRGENGLMQNLAQLLAWLRLPNKSCAFPIDHSIAAKGVRCACFALALFWKSKTFKVVKLHQIMALNICIRAQTTFFTSWAMIIATERPL